MDDNEIEKIDIGSLFQFDQFKKLIEHSFKTQKALKIKIKELESKMNNNKKIIHQSLNFIQLEINDITGKQDVLPYSLDESKIQNEEPKDKKQNQNEVNINIDQDKDQIKNKDQSPTYPNNDPIFLNNNTLIASSNTLPLPLALSSSGFDMKHINIVIKMMNSRLKANEEKIEELSKIPQNQEITIRRQSIISDDKHVSFDNEAKNNLEKKMSELEEKMGELSNKTKNYDLFDILENVKDGDGNQIEMSKVFVKSLERKVFTKFNIVDEKLKQLNNDTIEIKSYFKNIKQQNSNYQFNSNIYNKSNDDLNEVIAYYSKSIEVINDKLLSQHQENQLEISKSLGQLDDKMNQEFKIKEISILNQIKGILNNTPLSDGKKINLSEEIFNIENDTKALINKSIEESEKYLKSQIAGLNIDNIKKDIQTLLKALLGKLEKKDLQDLYHKFDSLNDITKEAKKQVEINKMDIDLMNQMIERLVKKLEFINGIVFSKQKQQNTSSNNNKETHIDITKFLTQTQMTQISASHQADIDKLTKDTESLKRVISKIEDQMKTFATEGDVRNLEQCLMNELDEYKISAMKKFSDKIETYKSLKYIDTQMKHYFDISGNNNLNHNHNHYNKKDNNGQLGGGWLIAKKPIGLFHCASCDSYIGELNNTVKYSHWNKIPMRDDIGKYRVRTII